MRTQAVSARPRAKRKDARAIGLFVARSLVVILIGFGQPGRQGLVEAQAPAAKPEPEVAPQGEPPVEVATEEPQSREQRMLRQAVYRDRNVQCVIENAQAALHAGDVPRAVGQLQQVFDQPGDRFIWIESEHRLSSARRRALDLLSAADRKTREFYEWSHAQEARQLFERGQAASDPALIAEVARRFFHTAAGFDATNWLATRWLDRGEYALAIRAWKRLAADPDHRRRVDAALMRKLDAAEHLCGGARRSEGAFGNLAQSREPAPAALSKINLSNGQPTPSRSVDLASLEEEAVSDQPLAAQTRVTHAVASFESFADVRLWGDSRDVSAIPFMTPTWRIDLSNPATASGSEIANLVRRWENRPSPHEEKRPIAIQSALSVGTAVVARDYEGFRALDVESGRPLWTYHPTTSLARALTEAEQGRFTSEAGSSQDSTREALMAAYAANSILGTLTTDGRRVFAVDSMEIRPRQAGVPMDEGGETQRGSQRLSRAANRLIALDVHHPLVDASGVVRPVWAVGGAVGTSHWFYRMDANDDGRVTQAEFLGTPEQFKTLDRNGDGAIDTTEAQQAGATLAQQPLHGHFFLGPPLSLDGRLYAITECDCQLNLVALSAANGAVLWVQGIGYVDKPIDEEPLRYPLACTPCSGGGVIVCPTQAGVLVGVDALDGALLWSYYCGDDDSNDNESSPPFGCRHTFGNPGFPNAALVEGNQVVVLPRQSEFIQCLDLSTGRGMWKQPRGDGEFVAAAADGVVMIVGERLCRGISLVDGSERWSMRLGESTGSGVRLGNEYLLPLADNHIAAIDIRSGARRRDLSVRCEQTLERSDPQADDFQHEPWTADGADENDFGEAQHNAPGNLISAGSLIVSCNAREVVAYPRAQALLEKVQQKLDAGPRQPADLALAADLALTLGQIAEAKADLSQINSQDVRDDVRDRVEQLRRTVLLEDLAIGTPRPGDRLRELDALSRTPCQRFRFLQAKADAAIRIGDVTGVLDATGAMAALGQEGLLASAEDPSFLVSPRGWLATTSDRVSRCFSSESLKIAKARVGWQQQSVLDSSDPTALERYLAVYGNWPEADRVRLRFAEVLAAAGKWQRSELLLLACERSPRPETVRAARRQLVRLWDQAGLAEEAADLLKECERQSLEEKRDPAEWQSLVEQLRADGLTRRAWMRLKAAEQPFGRARISQTYFEHCDNDLAEKYFNASRPSVTRAASAFQLIDAGTANDPKVSIVDRLSGTVVGPMEVPGHYWGITLVVTSQVGHFLPLGSRGAFHGISLLEHDADRPLWSNAPARIGKDGDPALVGPTGPTFCAFQSRRHLFVVDPGTGKLLWHRTDLDPQSGLHADTNRGVFGDDEVLVVLGADRLSYTVYRTSTGEELRQGSLDPATRQIPERRAFGRCLLYFISHDNTHRLRIWDPLTDRLLYDCPVCDRLLWKETGDEEVAVVTADGSLQIVDGRSGAIRVNLKLDSREFQNLNQISAFRDADSYYVNLQPMRTIEEPRRYAYCFGTDTTLPHADLRGDLLALDRRTGQLRWKRTFAQRTVLRVPALRLPVLVMLAIVGDRLNGNHRSMLVEVVDAKTGDTLAFDDDRFHNRIMQMTYEDDRHRIRLWGARSVVDLNFSSRPAGLAAESMAR